MSNYILGSHNSWSYLPAKKWWMKPFAFMARCQNISISKQYELGVRCFDLRIRFDHGSPVIAHGLMQYKYTFEELLNDLDMLNSKGDCYVRLLHEVRNKKQYTEESVEMFKDICSQFESTYENIKFWCGRNLYNWDIDYKFNNNPTCEEKYSSVQPPKLLDDWYPKIYAMCKNKEIKKIGTNCQILLIDYVNI